MYSDFFAQMLQMRDYAAPLAEMLAVPNVRSLIIRNRQNTRSPTYTEIVPCPVIVTAKPRLERMEGLQGLQIVTGDFEAQGVSRTYTRSQLDGSRIDFIIDGILENGVVKGGMTCDLVSISENTLTWNLTLREKVGEHQLF